MTEGTPNRMDWTQHSEGEGAARVTPRAELGSTLIPDGDHQFYSIFPKMQAQR
ncbi:hypothetical protein [Deinococcus sp. QL22]|uniref:hypothetical protein n=1 Tax=Deinococcus sp. QL22 TaxID=2939437 RepID=UPI002017C9A2|nr:hypothetical protein [Deinococcus sp. QL22]